MLAVDWFVAVFAFVLVCLFILLGVVCCVALAFWWRTFINSVGICVYWWLSLRDCYVWLVCFCYCYCICWLG